MLARRNDSRPELLKDQVRGSSDCYVARVMRISGDGHTVE